MAILSLAPAHQIVLGHVCIRETAIMADLDPLFQDSRRITRDNAPRRNRFGDHGTGADDAAVADLDSRHDEAAASDETILTPPGMQV